MKGKRLAMFGALAAVILLLSFLTYRTVNHPRQLNQHDIDTAIEKALASVTPAPSVASQAYAIISPSVVRIEVTAAKERKTYGIGTGVVIDTQGTILTANHVIEGASRIKVTFADGTQADATVIAQQPDHDTAVLRPDTIPDDLVPATLTSSATLNIGDEVVAVGNPFGLNNSVTDGVVSGLGRTFRSASIAQQLNNVVQFDAAVNPGNSGGPLVNRNGEVVGIVTGLLNPSQDAFIGIGFAVPIEAAAGAAGPPWE